MRSDRGLAWIGGLLVAAALGVGVLRWAGSSPMERGAEGALASGALAAVIAAPGFLVLLARFDRPALLLPTAFVLVPLSFLSFAGILLPLLVPAVALFVAYSRRAEAAPPPRLPVWALSPLVIGLVVAAVASLFLRDDPRSYTTATVSGSTSDVVTWAESLLSLAFVVVALIAGWWAASPSSRPSSTGSRDGRSRHSALPVSP